MKISRIKFNSTAKGQFGRGAWNMSLSTQYQVVYPAAAPSTIFAVQALFCQIPQMIKQPESIHMHPLSAVTHAAGRAENSVNTFCHARADHSRNPFHAVMKNTSHSKRVTRKGSRVIARGVWTGIESIPNTLVLRAGITGSFRRRYCNSRCRARIGRYKEADQAGAGLRR